MKYLEQLKELEREKKLVGRVPLPKLTEPGFGGSVSEAPPPRIISRGTEGALSPTQDRVEQRRIEALELLDRQPNVTRAFVVDTMSDGTTLIMVSIRGIGSGQLTIPPGRFDLGGIIKLFDELEAKNGRSH